ncbi:MAG: hypothetical protein IPP84_09045 [Propionivibrio sp.]|uniref:hypothetical protein n=1 Tax=Propionivibrio sp. TaxID=2212460 RepID=UPI0025FDA213|nr:hypothetical protein [Propionivibrio sp.]MBL0208097.1 hypothetical protein [Propionivibrio sp.]
MKVRLMLAVCVIALAACAGGPVSPDWQIDAYSALGRYVGLPERKPPARGRRFCPRA